MRIEYTRQAKKDIKALNEPMKSRIQQAIEKLPAGDTKKVTGRKHLHRLRVGDYRIIFVWAEPEVIEIFSIGPRGQIYKGV